MSASTPASNRPAPVGVDIQAIVRDTLSRAGFRAASWHLRKSRRPNSGEPCVAYNTSTCLRGLKCPDNHDPDVNSLRLLLHGPNVCKKHLLGPKGCPSSKASETAQQCPYSHDLTTAGLPLHDETLIKKELLDIENRALARVWLELGDQWAAMKSFWAEIDGKTKDTDMNTAITRSVELNAKLFEMSTAWMQKYEEESEKLGINSERRMRLEVVRLQKQPAFDIVGMSGVDIMKRLGVDKPFARQARRVTVAEDVASQLKQRGMHFGDDDLGEVDELELSEDEDIDEN